LAAKTQSDAPGNTEEFLGDINAPSSNIHEVMDQLWDPTPQNIRDELLSLNWELGMAGKDDKDWIAHKLMTKWDEYVKVAKPEDVEFVKSNMFTSDGKPKGLTSNQQAPWINKPTGPPTKMLK
jgi:hypothetical protein